MEANSDDRTGSVNLEALPQPQKSELDFSDGVLIDWGKLLTGHRKFFDDGWSGC